MLTAQRRAEFNEAVATLHLSTDSARSDRPVRILGIVLMVVGVIGTFVAYNASLAQDDLRDLGSSELLSNAFLAITVVGAALYGTSVIARVLRLWLLRQLVESQTRTDEVRTLLQDRV